MIQIPDNEIWLPKSIHYSLGKPIVTIVRLKTLPKGFVSDLDLRGETSNIPLSDIATDTNTAPNGIIFHLPRSGSTAVAKVLGKLPDSSCYFEPACLNELLTPMLSGQHTVKAEWLSKLLSIYSHTYQSQANAVYLKLSSWQLACIDLFRQSSPDTEFALVYRNPVEVIVQILQRPTGWMTPSVQPYLLKLLQIDRKPGSMAEFCTQVLAGFCQNALTQSSLILANQQSLNSDLQNSVLPHLAPGVDKSHYAPALSTLLNDSEQWEDTRPYKSDSEQLTEQASEKLRTLVAEQLSPLILELEQRFKN